VHQSFVSEIESFLNPNGPRRKDGVTLNWNCHPVFTTGFIRVLVRDKKFKINNDPKNHNCSFSNHR
jgi:hypothetical protein